MMRKNCYFHLKNDWRVVVEEKKNLQFWHAGARRQKRRAVASSFCARLDLERSVDDDDDSSTWRYSLDCSVEHPSPDVFEHPIVVPVALIELG